MLNWTLLSKILRESTRRSGFFSTLFLPDNLVYIRYKHTYLSIDIPCKHRYTCLKDILYVCAEVYVKVKSCEEWSIVTPLKTTP